MGLAADKGHDEIVKLLISRHEARELNALLRDLMGDSDDDLLTILLKDEIKMRCSKAVKKTDKKIMKAVGRDHPRCGSGTSDAVTPFRCEQGRRLL